MAPFLVALAMIAVFPPVGPAAGATTTHTFASVADAHVRAGQPTTNFGKATRLSVDNSPVTHTLIRFNLAGIGEDRVDSATLRLHSIDTSNLGGIFSRALSDTWSETAVTWNTAPASAPTPAASLGAVVPNTWYDVDLTTLVTGDGLLSLRVSSTSTDGADYVSREGSVALRPKLVVVTSPPPDTTPPTVSIASPSHGDTVSGDVAVAVDAADDVGVTSVELSIDGLEYGSDATAPYTFAWDTRTFDDGPHTLVATARDATPNSAASAPVVVEVENAIDAEPPSPPTDLTATPIGPARIDLSWTAGVDTVGIDHYAVLRGDAEIDTAPGTTYSDTTVSPGQTYSYAVIAYDAAGNASDPSDPVEATTPSAPASFTFAAAGDHASNSQADASLAALDASDAEFYLALGDLDYDAVNPDSTWCSYVTSHLPTKGPEFPFELVSGNHESQGHLDGYILNHTACLPDRLGAVPEPGSVYGANYSFDYPANAPLMRVVMIAPGITVEGTRYSFSSGSPHRAWLTSVIDDARADGIPWVTVGLHFNCLTVATRPNCEMGASLWNLLLDKHVDLVLNGHEHNYQRTKQLGLDPVACPSMSANVYVSGCIVDDGSDGVYPKGRGTVNVVAGTFGRSISSVNPNDAEAPFFAAIDDTTFGFMSYTVTPDRIDARFVNTTGLFTDTFSIVADAEPIADVTPPTTPANLVATLAGPSRVDLTWDASADANDVSYDVYRDGGPIGTSTTASFSDTAAVAGATHTYVVRAYDAAGNVSGDSAGAVITIPGGAPTLTFSASDDATILSGSPTTNTGAAPSLEVDNSPLKHFLIRFDVSGVGTRDVTGATLRLYCVNTSNLGGSFYPANGAAWSESTVTWNTAPAAGSTAAATLGGVTAGNWYEVNLSNAITGDGTYTFRIRSTSADGADYSSRQAAAGFRPQLVLSVAPSG